MNKVKVRFITIISLFLMLAIALGVAVGLLSPATAYAADKTYAPSTIFWARTGGEVKAYKASASAEEAYLTLVLSDGGSVEYHRNLALKWYEAEKDLFPSTGSGEGTGNTEGGTGSSEGSEGSTTPAKKGFEKPAEEGGRVNPGKEVYYSMTLAFPKVGFETLTITYQSAEENVSKKEQAINKLVFYAEGENLYAYVIDASHAEDEDYDLTAEEKKEHSLDKTGDLVITLSETETAGDFAVKIGETAVGTFTNIGGYYMEYRTSGTANTPMTFNIEFPEGAQNPSQKVAVKELNGQSLKVTGGEAKAEADADGTVEVTGGNVIDDTPAVLVMSEKLYAFTLGQRFSLSYEAIDVCDDSVSVSRDYYMLKKETVGEEGAEQTLYHAPNESPDAKNEDYKTLTTSTYFMPPNDDNTEEIEYVSIRMILDDGRDGASKEFIYLSWYADPASDVVHTIGDENTQNWFDYIKVDREKKGPEYTIITTDETTSSNDATGDYNSVVEEYQKALNDTAAKLSAGTGAYFYFPSMRSLISSKYADYRNLRFNVYYYEPGKTEGSSAASATSMRYNNLRIEIKQPGKYKFRVIASDAAGNNMQMYVDGELVDVTSSNVWDIDEIPDFTFNVGYTGATVEDAGEQTQGYRGSIYNIKDFDVIALAACEKQYTLYYVNSGNIAEGSRPSYAEFAAHPEKYMDSYLNDENSNVLVTIKEFNDEVEEEDWENVYPDNLYHWNPDSSLSFVPQESGYYVVRLHLTDPNMGGVETDAYQVIDVRNPVDYIPGTTNWFENNVTSVVLFSISAVLAVIIVVLFVVKPSDKTVEEVDLDELKGKNKKNK